MMLSLPKYDCYKNSEVDWLGEIPAHWSVTKIKFTCKYNQITLDEKTDPNLVITYVDIGSVSQGKINKTETFTFRNAPSRARRKAKKGDTIISTVRTYLKAISYIDKNNSNNIFSTGFCILSPNKNIENKFFTYLLQSEYFISDIVRFSEGVSYPAITPLKLSNLKVCIPPVQEQEKIVKFLDRKCEEVESAIALKQRLIELLEEQSAIVINQAVTKGLNPNAPMKDSGIDWLGDIPAHWEVLRTKNIFRLITQPAPNNNNYELLSVYTDIGVKPRKELEERGNKASTTDGYWMVKKGDIVVNKLLAWMGAIGISDYDGVTSPAYDILRPYKPVESKFYHYLFRNPICLSKLKQHSKGIMEMRLRLYFDEFGNIKLPYPSFEEQEKIVKYLEQKTAEIEKLKEKTLQQIEKLKEFKQILIAEAVTGKIKV